MHWIEPIGLIPLVHLSHKEVAEAQQTGSRGRGNACCLHPGRPSQFLYFPAMESETCILTTPILTFVFSFPS